MNGTKYVLQIAGTMWLFFAAFHIVGYFTGWTEFHVEDNPTMILGGIAGGISARFVVKRMVAENARKVRGVS